MYCGCGNTATTMYLDVSSEFMSVWSEFPVCGRCLTALNRENNKEGYAEQDRRDAKALKDAG
jgi:hypothetical protein